MVLDKTAAGAAFRPCGPDEVRNVSQGGSDGTYSPMFGFLMFFRAVLQAMNASEELKCLTLQIWEAAENGHLK